MANDVAGYVAEKRAERARALQREKDKAAEAERNRATSTYIQEMIAGYASSSRDEPPTASVESATPPIRRRRQNTAAAAEQPPAMATAAESTAAPPIRRRRQNMAAAVEQPPPTVTSESAPPPIRRRPEQPPQTAEPAARRRQGEMADNSSRSSVVVNDLSPYLKVYRNGSYKKLAGTPRVNPSETIAENGIFSKNVTISQTVSARVYCPAEVLQSTPPKKKVPIFVYYHGGGFCLESALSSKTHGYVIQLAAKANAVVVSVEYRVAPQNPLPAAFEDAWEALTWVASQSSEHSSSVAGPVKQAAAILKTGYSLFHKIAPAIITGAVPAPQSARTGPVIPWLVDHGDFTRLFVGGDGAGGTLAHYVSLQVTGIPLPNEVKILGTILCFPYFLEETNSRTSIAYRLWMYLRPEGAYDDRINPFGAHYHPFQFRKMFVCYGERDPLKNVAVNFVKAMKSVDVWKGKVVQVEVKGRGHCFQVEEPATFQAQKLIKDIASFIKGPRPNVKK